ncbi:MAG: adenine nucleotide alpha hydrolase family protein [Desulfohalobiaceae bacterium]|nr:adenine nucleotide alpha hydrolase family protein [Desulfohalobiaceae bacterium]
MGRTFTELPARSKCSRCRGRARIGLPSHNARFCPDCYLLFFSTAVQRALKRLSVPREEPLLVAVSGGKDSLTAWDILNELGYATHGLHINLGIGDFSEASRERVDAFARARGLSWSEYSLQREFGYSLPEINRRFQGKICSVCGRLKRQHLNRLAVRENYGNLVTGHNLDDEAGRLLGNLVGNRQEYVRKQSPYLPSPHPYIPAKLKPLYRLDISEIRIYCELRGIEPAEIKCPLSRGATSHYFKEALDMLEGRMPGTKRQFLFAYINTRQGETGQEADFGECCFCGHPAYADVCGVCSLKGQMEAKN